MLWNQSPGYHMLQRDRFLLGRPIRFGCLVAVLIVIGCSISGVTRVYRIPHGTLVLTDVAVIDNIATSGFTSGGGGRLTWCGS
jgi:hypothetical protein